MKRLREEADSKDPTMASVARLLADVEPLSESDVRRARVLRAINRGRKATPSRFQRPLFVALVVACTAATAGATIGFSRWAMTTNQVVPLNRTSVRLPDALAARSAPGASENIEMKSAEETAAPHQRAESAGIHDVKLSRAAKSEAAGASPGAASSPVAAGASAVVRPPSPAAQKSAQASDAALVQQAVEALRQANDPVRAAALLQEYRQRAPSGALAEEALALSIEVALTQKSDQARTYAERYLKAYPQGRFTALAQRALR